MSIEPTIKKLSIKRWLDNHDIELSVLVASDGIVPNAPSAVAGAQMYSQCIGNWQAKDAHFSQKNIAQYIGKHAAENISHDNTTVLYATIPPRNKQSLVLVVCDGHDEKGGKAAEVARDEIAKALGKDHQKPRETSLDKILRHKNQPSSRVFSEKNGRT